MYYNVLTLLLQTEMAHWNQVQRSDEYNYLIVFGDVRQLYKAFERGNITHLDVKMKYSCSSVNIFHECLLQLSNELRAIE